MLWKTRPPEPNREAVLAMASKLTIGRPSPGTVTRAIESYLSEYVNKEKCPWKSFLKVLRKQRQLAYEWVRGRHQWDELLDTLENDVDSKL